MRLRRQRVERIRARPVAVVNAMRDTDSKFLFTDRVPEAFREKVTAALKADCTSAESAEYLRIANDAQRAALSVAGGASPEHAALDVWIREVAILEAAKADAERADAGATAIIGTLSAPLDLDRYRETLCAVPDCSSTSPLLFPPGWSIVIRPSNGTQAVICEQCSGERLLWPKDKPYENTTCVARPCPHCRRPIARGATCPCFSIAAYADNSVAAAHSIIERVAAARTAIGALSDDEWEDARPRMCRGCFCRLGDGQKCLCSRDE